MRTGFDVAVDTVHVRQREIRTGFDVAVDAVQVVVVQVSELPAHVPRGLHLELLQDVLLQV